MRDKTFWKIIGSIFTVFAVLYIFTAIISLSGQASYTKKYFIGYGTNQWAAIEPKNEKVLMEVEVIGNISNIDIYVMSLYNYSRNMDLEGNFTDYLDRQGLPWKHNVTYDNITFDPPDDDNYVIVFDNSDNGEEKDSIPLGDVVVTLDVEYTRSEKPMTLKGIIVSLLSILFILYTLNLYYKERKKIKGRAHNYSNEGERD